MKKNVAKVHPVKCECSTCGQIATVVKDTPHNYCRGFKAVKPLPAMFRNLTNPARKGMWKAL